MAYKKYIGNRIAMITSEEEKEQLKKIKEKKEKGEKVTLEDIDKKLDIILSAILEEV